MKVDSFLISAPVVKSILVQLLWHLLRNYYTQQSLLFLTDDAIISPLLRRNYYA
jgi:hypothetical protein